MVLHRFIRFPARNILIMSSQCIIEEYILWDLQNKYACQPFNANKQNQRNIDSNTIYPSYITDTSKLIFWMSFSYEIYKSILWFEFTLRWTFQLYQNFLFTGLCTIWVGDNIFIHIITHLWTHDVIWLYQQLQLYLFSISIQIIWSLGT